MGGNKGKVSSYAVFMKFVTEDCDASGILGSDCYQKWVETRKGDLKQPEESFRRVLTAHVCGLIGRKPFPADVEVSLLRCLRRKQVWPCFNGSTVTIGVKGFRKTGFHESRRGIFGPNAASSYLSSKKPQQTVVNPQIKLNPALLANSFVNTAPRRSSAQHSQSATGSSGSRRESQSTVQDPSSYLDYLPSSQDVDFSSGLTGHKRGLDIEPLNFLSNGLMNPAKKLRDNFDSHSASGQFQSLYNQFQNVNSSFLLQGFQDIHVPSADTTSNASNGNADHY